MEPARAAERDATRSEQSSYAGLIPPISLPKGGGALRGIGEKFAANPVTGTASMSVPLATSPGRSGFGPQLSLSYDSGSGNGLFGFGWNLSLPSITRKTEKGLPRYQDAEGSDVFILSGAEDLVPEFKKDAAGTWLINAGKHVIHDTPRIEDGVTYAVRRYRPRVEGLFARIERWTNVVITWLVNGSATDAEVDVESLIWLWDVTTKQDKALIERNAAGVRSRAYTPGPYSTLETWTSRFVAQYLQGMALHLAEDGACLTVGLTSVSSVRYEELELRRGP